VVVRRMTEEGGRELVRRRRERGSEEDGKEGGREVVRRRMKEREVVRRRMGRKEGERE
jgi:hypothetical protein